MSSDIVVRSAVLLLEIVACKFFRTSLAVCSAGIAVGIAKIVPAAAGTYFGIFLAAAAAFLPSCNDLHMTGGKDYDTMMHSLGTFVDTLPFSKHQVPTCTLPRR